MKQYKLVGWNMPNVTDEGHGWWVDQYPIDFPIVVNATGNLDRVGLAIVLVDVCEERHEFSIYWFVWEPLETMPE